MILDLDFIPNNHVGQKDMVILGGFWASEKLISQILLVEITLKDPAVMMACLPGRQRETSGPLCAI